MQSLQQFRYIPPIEIWDKTRKFSSWERMKWTKISNLFRSVEKTILENKLTTIINYTFWFNDCSSTFCLYNLTLRFHFTPLCIWTLEKKIELEIVYIFTYVFVGKCFWIMFCLLKQLNLKKNMPSLTLQTDTLA